MKAHASLWSLVLVAIGGATLAAQDAAEPRARERSTVRRERLDRLRNIGGRLLDSIAGPAEGSAQAAGLDVSRINRGLEAGASAIQADEPRIQSLRVAFDRDETDFAQDRARLVAQAALASSAWSPQPTRAELALAARVERPEGRPQAAVQGKLLLETDCLALAGRLLVLAQGRLTSDSHNANRADSAFRSRLAEKLERTKPPESMDDLADLFAYVSGLRLNAYNEAVEQVAIEFEQSHDPARRSALSGELSELRRQRDLLFLARPRIVRGEDGQVEMISLTVAGDYPGVNVERLQVSVTARSFAIEASWNIVQGLEWYLLAKPLVLVGLQRLQNGDGRGLAAAATASPLWKDAKKHVFGTLLEPQPEEVPAPAPVPNPQ